MKIYECDHHQKLMNIVEMEEPVAQMVLEFTSNTNKAPSAAMLASYESGNYDLYFDYVKKKWSKKEIDKSGNVAIAVKELDNEISMQLRNGTFEYSGLIFYTSDKAQLKMSEIASLVYFDIAEYPLMVKSAGDNYLQINDKNEFLIFYEKFLSVRSLIREIGRTIKYGGEIAGMTFPQLETVDYDTLGFLSGYDDFDKLGIIKDNQFKTIFEQILYPEQFVEEDEA